MFFEEENINTLTMDGELLLVILSSVAQQEVENISANVKKGLKMKMQRGELVGFQGCLGYEDVYKRQSLSLFNCIGFSNVGFSYVRFSNVEFYNVGETDAGTGFDSSKST